MIHATAPTRRYLVRHGKNCWILTPPRYHKLLVSIARGGPLADLDSLGSKCSVDLDLTTLTVKQARLILRELEEKASQVYTNS